MILTSKEEAHEIFDNMYNVESNDFHNMKKEDAIQCALITVEKILYILEFRFDFKMEKSIKHYQEVKEELLKLLKKERKL